MSLSYRDERCDSPFQIIPGMYRGQLDSDASLSFGYHRVAETYNVYPFFEQILGHQLRKLGVAYHDGDYWVIPFPYVESSLFHPLAEISRILR